MKDLIPFLLFSISSAFTPGPNNFMLMNSGLHFGVKRSFPHYLGVTLGFPVMVFLISLGLGAIFVKYTWIKTTLKIVGSAYMFYLAWQIIRSHSKATANTATPITFFQACLFQWVNPKAWLMGVGAISIYTLSSNYIMNGILLSVIFFLVCIPSGVVWLLFGNSLQYILRKDSHRAVFNLVMAVSLIASILLIIFD